MTELAPDRKPRRTMRETGRSRDTPPLASLPLRPARSGGGRGPGGLLRRVLGIPTTWDLR